MLARIRKAQEEREGGFTLIELLVVIIIIGILAAIAIPTFLRQREKGYRADVKSALKNSATAIESAATETGGKYDDATITLANLKANEGLKHSANVTLALTVQTANRYCFQGTDSRLPAAEVWSYDSDKGAPAKEACA